MKKEAEQARYGISRTGPSTELLLNLRGTWRRYLILPVPVVFLLMAFTLQLSVFQETIRHQNCMNKQQFIDRGAKPHQGQDTFKQFISKVIWYCCKCQHNVINYMKIVSSI